ILLHLISAPDNVCEDKEHEYATSEG
ncbi:biotin-lipoyl like family protein, partial [Vibrio parahaemolyticus V-223/04]